MLCELPRALETLIAARDTRVIVVASALDRYFSSGADLRSFGAWRGPRMREWVTTCHRMVALLRASPKPLLAAINGVAVGGGVEIAWHCDVRFAAADARIGQPEIDIAYVPPIGATQALARLMGRNRALRFLYEGDLVGAAEARALGLVDVVVPPGQLHAAVAGYARRLAAKPANALAAIRRCVTLGGALPFDAGLDLELEEAVALAGSPNFAEGIEAFLAKRPPRWT
ncbi:enoyl-CoA hydratase [Burkholderiales bacterium]|nr:enoyl-CoA hydratase [Burkholderiales bacterium]